MNRALIVLILGGMGLFKCSSATVIRSDDKSAVIEAFARESEDESKDAWQRASADAEKKAEEILGARVERTKEENCQTSRVKGQKEDIIYRRCTWHFRKREGQELDSILVLAQNRVKEQWPDINEQIQQKLLVGADINATDEGAWPALAFAVAAENVELVRILLKAGAKFNSPTKNYGTILHIAARGDSLEIIEMLMSAGADQHRIDQGNDGTPLSIAANRCRLDFIEVMLKAKNKQSTKQIKNGLNSALRASTDGHCTVDIVQRLLKAGAKPSKGIHHIPFNYEKQPLEKVHQVIDALLKAGANINEQDETGHTVLIAARRHNRGLIGHLQARGAKYSQTDMEEIEEDRNQKIAQNEIVQQGNRFRVTSTSSGGGAESHGSLYARGCENQLQQDGMKICLDNGFHGSPPGYINSAATVNCQKRPEGQGYYQWSCICQSTVVCN